MTHLRSLWETATQRLVLGFGLWFTFGNYAAGTLIWPDTIINPNAMHHTQLLGFIPVMINGWHLYFHLLTGLICLLCAVSYRRARTAALAVGGLYLLTGGLGLLLPGDIYGFIMADTFGNWVHILEAVGLLAISLFARSRNRGELPIPAV